MQCPFKRRLVDFGQLFFLQSTGALGLADQASLTQELVRPQNGDNRFLALLGVDADFDVALFNVKHCIGSVALRKNDFFLSMRRNDAALGCCLQKSRRVKPSLIRFGCFALFAQLDAPAIGWITTSAPPICIELKTGLELMSLFLPLSEE
jgi:hypothetical protein